MKFKGFGQTVTIYTYIYLKIADPQAHNAKIFILFDIWNGRRGSLGGGLDSEESHGACCWTDFEVLSQCFGGLSIEMMFYLRSLTT